VFNNSYINCFFFDNYLLYNTIHFFGKSKYTVLFITVLKGENRDIVRAEISGIIAAGEIFKKFF